MNSPNITIEQAKSFADLARKLEAKADGYAQLAIQAKLAEAGKIELTDELEALVERSHEVDFGIAERLCRNVAEVIRAILKK